jgi:hypothetical protein
LLKKKLELQVQILLDVVNDEQNNLDDFNSFINEDLIRMIFHYLKKIKKLFVLKIKLLIKILLKPEINYE